MDTIETYRRIIRKVFHEYANLQEATDEFVLPPYAHGNIQKKVIFDSEADTYLLMALGWDDAKRIHGCIVHIDIIDGKLWFTKGYGFNEIALNTESLTIWSCLEFPKTASF